MPSNPKANLITAWSFSRWMDYRTCPAKFKFKVIDKLQEPPNAAMQRGTDIHKMAEDYTRGKLRTLPKELGLFKKEFAKLRKEKVLMVEESWAFKADWTQTTWNDWTGCWLRIKMDVAYINVEHNALVPIDHKTGKIRDDKTEEYMLQLHLYGTGSLYRLPTVDVVSPRLWYLDQGIIYPNPEEEEVEFKPAEKTIMRKAWEDRVKPMFMDRTFKPTPSEKACRYCHYRKANGGPCKY